MITCDNCGEDVARYIVKFHAGRMIQSCHVCEHPRHSMIGATNPYSDLTLEHCLDERGQPVRVTSKRQLLEAEKRYHFKSVVANMMSDNFDKPPQDPLSNLHPADRIVGQMQEQVGRSDSKGNKLGFLFPDTAAAMLKEVKEKGIDINTW